MSPVELDPEQFTLRAATPASWGPRIQSSLRTLLVEQAHLEKKAAAAASRFLFVLPQESPIQRALSQLAREELVHFERTLRLLDQRGIPYAQQTPCQYAGKLKAACHSHLPQRLVDELLISALIEARSCERMACLADALPPAELEVAEFYRDLVEAEARHHMVYVEAAAQLDSPMAVAARWRALALHEAETLAVIPFSPHLHGGHGEPA